MYVVSSIYILMIYLLAFQLNTCTVQGSLNIFWFYQYTVVSHWQKSRATRFYRWRTQFIATILIKVGHNVKILIST